MIISPKSTGIYKFLNLENSMVYVGHAAISFEDRLTKHIGDFLNKRHVNKHLQRAWYKYGDMLKYVPIEEVPKGTLSKKEFRIKILEREQHWMDFYQSYVPGIGYNLCPIAGSTLGYKYTDVQKQKLSEWQRGEKSNSAKLTKEEVDEIRRRYLNEKMSFREMSEIYKVSGFAIWKIIHNKSWQDDKYFYIIDRSSTSPKAKLNWNLVNEIRSFYASSSGTTQEELAQRYNVDVSTIKRIVQNRTWKDKTYIYDSNIGVSRRGFATTPLTSKDL